jgi:hypothetical protein
MDRILLINMIVAAAADEFFPEQAEQAVLCLRILHEVVEVEVLEVDRGVLTPLRLETMLVAVVLLVEAVIMLAVLLQLQSVVGVMQEVEVEVGAQQVLQVGTILCSVGLGAEQFNSTGLLQHALVLVPPGVQFLKQSKRNYDILYDYEFYHWCNRFRHHQSRSEFDSRKQQVGFA